MRKLRLLVLAACLLGLLIAPASGQLLLGNIGGTVTDATGAPIPNAKVEAQNTGTNLVVTATTQGNGIYQLPNLPLGTYKVTVSQPGFQTRAFTSIDVQANRTATVDAQLQIATQSTTVDVTSTPALVNSSDATNGYVLNSSTIQKTPLGTGSFTQLALLSPGVNAEFLPGSGTNAGMGNQNIWANGQRDTSNNFSINAVSANNLFNGKSSSQVAESRFVLNTGQNYPAHSGGDIQTSTSVYNAIGQGMPTPAPESVEELRVNTSQYDSSQGGNSGAQVAVITRSGTNALHGQLYEYFQNDALNSAYFFRNADPSIPAGDKVPPLRYNRFGATLGGPIIKDKLFFFGSYQGIRDHDSLGSYSYATVPQHLTDDRSAAAIANVVQQDFKKTIAPRRHQPDRAPTPAVQGQWPVPDPQRECHRPLGGSQTGLQLADLRIPDDVHAGSGQLEHGLESRLTATACRSSTSSAKIPAVIPSRKALRRASRRLWRPGARWPPSTTPTFDAQPHLGTADRFRAPEGVRQHGPGA